MKKRSFVKIFALVLVAATLCLTLASCSQPPELDSVYDRFVELIEGSREVNILFFGVGLPVYERGQELSEKIMVYSGFGESQYDHVMENTPYLTIEAMKAAAELVYSSEYLAALYETAFDGVLVGETSYVRYYEDSEWIYQNTYAESYVLSERIYDYGTMEIVEPSNATYVNVDIESYTIDKPENRQTVRLSFTYENGNWYLDSPTY